jgi:hypothetical protein
MHYKIVPPGDETERVKPGQVAGSSTMRKTIFVLGAGCGLTTRAARTVGPASFAGEEPRTLLKPQIQPRVPDARILLLYHGHDPRSARQRFSHGRASALRCAPQRRRESAGPA